MQKKYEYKIADRFNFLSRKILIEIGWKKDNSNNCIDSDIDVMVFMIRKDEIFPKKENIIFYNQLSHHSKSIKCSGETMVNRDGIEYELVEIDLSKIPPDIDRLIFGIKTYNHLELNDNDRLKCLEFSYLKVLSSKINKKKLFLESRDDFSTKNLINLSELYRCKSGWKLKSVDEKYDIAIKSIF